VRADGAIGTKGQYAIAPRADSRHPAPGP
jgi:hypothetical protein